MLQDVQTFGGGQVKILTACACGEPWLDFVVLRGKKEFVGCCAKLEKAPRSRISRLGCVTRSADDSGHVRYGTTLLVGVLRDSVYAGIPYI